MSFAVTGVRYLAVLVSGSAFAEVPVDREADNDDDHEAQVHQKRHGHSAEPHRVLHLPGESAQHAEHRAVAPRELRVRVTGDTVRLGGSVAGQAQVMA